MAQNINTELFEEAEIFDKPALFSNYRLDRATVPKNLYCYDLRGSDYDPGEPITVEQHVLVNYAGCVITAEKLEFSDGADYIRLGDDGLNFLGEEMSVREFCTKHSIEFLASGNHQQQNKKSEVVGTVSFANGDTMSYTDAADFVDAIKEELPYKPTTGFQYKVLTDDPAVRKAVDDVLFDMFGERNPRTLEEYDLPEHGTEPHESTMTMGGM